MIIVAVDDEREGLNAIKRAIQKAAPDADIYCFEESREALDFAGTHQVDVAFLDIEMPEMDGLVLAKKLKQIYEATNIIFVTAFYEYSIDAFEMHVSGYVMKPVNPKHVRKELDNLRNPVLAAEQRVRFQCFGNFEVFVDGRPVEFRRSKSKEILAYLVDREGAAVRNKELAAVLWEDKPYSRTLQSHLQILLVEMNRAMTAAGAGDVLIKQYGSYAIDVSKVSCDAYQFSKGEQPGVNAYYGEYMANYSWGELKIGILNRE